MIDVYNVGKQIALLRRERGYTGETLAERLHVSPQAVSKWENAKCLPETAVLPDLAKALNCSIDSLLCPRELFILEAIYTDGQTHLPVTQFLNDRVYDNSLNIYVNEPFIGASLDSDRLKVLTVKFQTGKGTFFSYALQNDPFVLGQEKGKASQEFPASQKESCFANNRPLQIIGAYYGNGKEYASVMQKMEHYEYFKWDKIPVNHETFPSATACNDTEYLTLIYLNSDGIHTVSCPESETLYYGNRRTQFFLHDYTKCALKNVMKLSWEKGMECPWAGALYAALRYMGEPYSYHQIMGMSGACYRTCFVDVWDYSCTDALVAYDYATPLFKNLGYSFHMACRLEKRERKAERLAIMKDIQNGKPVLASNLRIAPEWGLITGYTDNGSRLLCRTYFDQEVFDDLEREDCPNPQDRRTVFEDNQGYLFNDCWPFLILHFDEKKETPSPPEALTASLETLIASFCAKESRGYTQGEEAYHAWIKALSLESDFCLTDNPKAVLRRLGVNDNLLLCLADARRAAAAYLRESISLLPVKKQAALEKIAANCQTISDLVFAFRKKLSRSQACAVSYHIRAFGVSTPQLRQEQIRLLTKALELDTQSCRLAQQILERV